MFLLGCLGQVKSHLSKSPDTLKAHHDQTGLLYVLPYSSKAQSDEGLPLSSFLVLVSQSRLCSLLHMCTGGRRHRQVIPVTLSVKGSSFRMIWDEKITLVGKTPKGYKKKQQVNFDANILNLFCKV